MAIVSTYFIFFLILHLSVGVERNYVVEMKPFGSDFKYYIIINPISNILHKGS